MKECDVMAGYWIPGYGICSYQQYQDYIKGEFTMAGLNDVVNAMNTENKENTVMEETRFNEGMTDLSAIMKKAEQEANDDIYRGDPERLEGQGLKDVFGDSAKVMQLAIQNKKGTTAADGETFGVIRFEKDGKPYITFVSGRIKEQIAMMIDLAGGEYNLNKLVKEQGIVANFGKKVVTSDDGQHTNVKIWFDQK